MGLFNRSNKKSEREQKIKELVGGTLMSDSFKKKVRITWNKSSWIK